MTTITRFHVSWLQTSALPEIVSAGAGTPSLGTFGEYTAAFSEAPATGATWVKPWGTYTRSHQYWSNLLSSAYSRADALSAWTKQVPLRRAEGFVPTTELGSVTAACERFLYPSGVGVAVTATFEGEAALPDAIALHASLCQEKVLVASDGVPRRITSILAHELDELENEVLGEPSSSPVRARHLRTVTTIAGATGRTSSKNATGTLQQLCYPGQQPGRTQVFPARSGNHSGTLRVAGQDSQASWAPNQCTTKVERDGLTCYHHNVVLSALHTMQLLNLVELAGENFATAPDRAQQLYKRAGTVLGWLYGGASAYATRFTPALIDESGLVDRTNRIRSRLSGEPPLHLRSA